MSLILSFVAGFLACLLVVLVANRRAEQAAFRSLWGP